MSNTIITHENGEKKTVANEKSKNEKTAGPASDRIEGASPSDTKIHLLFTKPLVHTPGAGINLLVDAGAYIFTWMGKIVQMRSQQNLRQLHLELINEIHEFQTSLISLNYMPKHLSEFIPIATYAVCSTLDDIIGHTPWGRDGKWDEFRLLDSYEQEILSRENFLIILERFIQDQKTYIDIMEFIYICLNLGFNYSCHMSGFNIEQMQRIMHSLYKRIRLHYGNFSKVLSPYSLRIAPVNLSQHTPIANSIQQFENHGVLSELSNGQPILSQEMKNLESNLHRITKCLSNKSIRVKNNKIHLATLPWILIAGSVGAGKSTLLENSKIKFIIDNNVLQNDFTNIQEFNNWNWWVTPSAVLIDMPSSHVSMKRNQYSFSNSHWENLLDLILQERGSDGVNGVTLVVSLNEIMDKANHQVLVAQLTKKIDDLKSRFGQELPLNLVISKCDLMPGFCDFFDDYTTEELFQPWGISLSQIIKSDNLLDSFYNPFDFLIKKLNQQVIYRLHQERYLETFDKFHIKDFPLQVERLKENLGDVIKKVVKETHRFKLKGFYLTSARQSSLNNNESRLPKTISNNELLESFSVMDIPAVPDRSYFIKHLLMGGLVSEQSNSGLPTKLVKQNFFDFLYKLTRGI